MAGISGEDLARQRRVERMDLFRALLALCYLAAEAFLSDAGVSRIGAVVIGLFLAYSIFLLLYRSRPLASKPALLVLFTDLVFLNSLIFWRSTGAAATLAAIFYAFLVLESWSHQGAREVILIATALPLVAYSARTRLLNAQPNVVTVETVLFLLVVAGLVAFVFSDQRYPIERRIGAIAGQTSGVSATATVTVIHEALQQLASWSGCSHALLAFWDQRQDFYCLCRYPPAAEAQTQLLEDSREWSVCRGERLDLVANEISERPEFDLHPHLIRKFQIYNALGCALLQEGKIIGRLLMLNRVLPVQARQLRRLKRLAPVFARLAQHLLVIKDVERAAYERERYRVAQDFHDGPLQSVISFQMRVHTIRKILERDPAAAADELDQLQELARRQVADMRTFVNSMRPVEVDTSSLTAAARRLVDDFQKESGVPVTFVGGEEPVGPPGKIGVDILQLIREALHNIHKHAQATHVLFSLEQSDSDVLIAVSDNGKGYRFGGKYTLQELEQLRLGPHSIKQRMRALGGDLVLESQPGHGTSLRLKIPLY